MSFTEDTKPMETDKIASDGTYCEGQSFNGNSQQEIVLLFAEEGFRGGGFRGGWGGGFGRGALRGGYVIFLAALQYNTRRLISADRLQY